MARVEMFLALCLLTAVVYAAPPLEQAAPTSHISGTVVGNAGEPLKDARIILQDSTGQMKAESLTNEQGSFRIDDALPGRYRLQAILSGYVPQYIGATIPAGPPAVLTIEAGRAYTFSFRLIPACVVAGTVYNFRQEPAANIQIQLMVAQYFRGRRILRRPQNIQPVITNEMGDYRLAGLPPGTYYVKAMPGRDSSTPPQVPGTPVVTASSLSATYYPGVSDPDQAIPIHVSAEIEVQGISFPLFMPSFLTLSGRIVNPMLETTNSPAYEYYLVRKNGRMFEVPTNLSNYATADGKFEFRNVPPGSYELFVGYHSDQIVDKNDPAKTTFIYTGRASVDLVDKDVSDLTVAIEPGIDIFGEIRLDASAAALQPDFSRVQPYIFVADTMPEILAPTAFLARRPFVQSDGTFQIPHAARGRYVFRLIAPRGLYLEAARLGAKNILDQAFEIDGSSEGRLIIELSGSGAQVSGTVTDRNDNITSGARVILVPPVNFRDDEQAYRTARTDSQGRFSITAIRPGGYTLFAFEDIEESRWLDPEFMTPYLARGLPVELMKGQQVQRVLKVISPRG